MKNPPGGKYNKRQTQTAKTFEMLRFYTAGESHGKELLGIIEGVPSGLALSAADIDSELKRRQKGYGRGGRMKIESDHAEIVCGVRQGFTTGAPIGLVIENRDWANWRRIMSAEPAAGETPQAVEKLRITRPRPGHADLPGALKYARKDIRDILERASARETAMRVALGAVAKKLLSEFGIQTGSFVFQIGREALLMETDVSAFGASALARLAKKAKGSALRCPDPAAEAKMKSLIDEAAGAGDTLGGRFTVFVTGLPPGLGSHTQWDRRLEGRLAQALMSIQAVKAVELGGGIGLAASFGSQVMDEIFYSKRKGFYRRTNRMGGIEGGMTNGEPLVAHAAMKPIPTLKNKKALRSVDILTKKPFRAAYERSDVCAVPAAAVIAEGMCALVCAGALLEKTGGDSIGETRRNYDAYVKYLADF